MPFLCRQTAVLAVIAVTCRAQALSKIQITVQEGAGAVVPRSALSSRSFVVLVSTADGRPLPHATVNFRLPAEGATGVFSSGFRSEALLTDDRGLAHVRGIVWGAEPGKLLMRVSASYDGQRAEAEIPIEISATAAPSSADRRAMAVPGHSSAKRWVILATAAGGAVAGIALAGGRSSAPGGAVAAASTAVSPTIGAPSITIGRP